MEFDSLEAQKRTVKVQAAEKRAEVGRLAAAAASAYAALAQAQQEELELQKQLDNFTETQSRMLVQELEMLDELETVENGADVALPDQSEFLVGDHSWDFFPSGSFSPQPVH